MLAPCQLLGALVLGLELFGQLLLALGECPLEFSQLRLALGVRGLPLFQLDGAQRQSVSLLCGADAATLAVAAPAELILTGASGTH